MFGSQMASSLRRMADDEFPILILASGKGSTNEATDIVKGKNNNFRQKGTKRFKGGC